MTRASRGLGLAAVGAALGGGLFLYTNPGAAGYADQTYQITLHAEPRTIDEGDLVEFTADVSVADQAADEGAPDAARNDTYTWTMDDGSQPTSGLGLGTHAYRFLDGGPGYTPYDVRLRVGDSEAAITIAVSNVAPTIRNVSSTRPAVSGRPIAFDVSATDPGRHDPITYTWDFADGGTATGQHASHTYATDGVYDVTVTADDGDGGQDTATLRVSVGNVSSFTVSGDIALPETTVDRVVLIGTGSPCAFRLGMHSGTDGLGMVLTASLNPGLGEFGYPIAEANEWDGTTLDERARPGVFFADFSPPNAVAIRDFGGTKVGGPFWSRGGTVNVDFFDGTFLELSYSATLVENVPAEYNPRTVFIEGSFAQALGGPANLGNVLGGMTTGAMNIYQCGRDTSTPFRLERHQPTRNATNVSSLNPEIELTFSQPVNPTTIAGRVQLDRRAQIYSDSGGLEYNLPVEGTWEMMPGDPYTIRFVPQSRLEDGVVFCARVRAGRPGLRSREGGFLEAVPPDFPDPAIERACGASKPWFQSQDWAFSTQVALESAHVDVYQASHVTGDTPLAPRKSTVSRVYVQWSAPERIVADAQVKRFQARVSVRADGHDVYPPKRVWITRPDQFTAEDARHAANTINFYDWRPTGLGPSANIQTVVEFIDESGSVLDTFEGPVEPVKVWDRTEILSFDYYFLKIDGCTDGAPEGCDWTDEVPPEWHRRGLTLAREGALFTTQTFPVLETQGRAMGDYWINEPPLSGPCTETDPTGLRYRCYRVGLPGELSAERYLASRLYAAALNSYADIVVGIVPPGFPIDWAGLMVPFAVPGMRVVLVDLATANSMVLAHEFGHFFELGHCPEDPSMNVSCDYWIQGFKVNPSGRSGFNKHDIEGNQEATLLRPVMRWQAFPPEEAFISASNYLALFGGIATAPGRQARATSPVDLRNPLSLLADLIGPVTLRAQVAEPDGRLFLRGSLTTGGLTLDQILHERGSPPMRPSNPDPNGDLTLDLLDGAGRVLRTMPFRAAPPVRGHGIAGGPSTFFLDVEAPAGLHAVRVTGPGGLTATKTRSPAAPTISAKTSDTDGSRRTLQWSTADADGEAVLVSVYIRADGDRSWRGVTVDSSRSDLTIPVAGLPSGRRVVARIVASDGFNSSTTDVDLGRGAPLSVEAVAPGTGATGVPVSTDVTAWVSAPLTTAPTAAAPGTGQFRLTGPDGQAVFADITYRPGTGLLILTPVGPLAPGTRYTVAIEGLEDLSGSRLSTPVVWTFVTGDDGGRR